MKLQNRMVPSLRFTDEEGREFPEWAVKSIYEIGQVVTGKTPSTTDKSLWVGDLPFITPTDITETSKYQTNSKRYIRKPNDSLILPPQSILYTCIASIGKICISVHSCATNQQINAIVPQRDILGEFIYYSLLESTPRIKASQGSTTVPIISKSQFEKIRLNFPCLKEQQKIASFLSSLDLKIEQLNRKKSLLENYKKGMMQKLFSQEIRFRDDEGREYPEWDYKQFTDLFKVQSTRNHQIKSSEVSQSGQVPVVDQGKLQIAGYSDASQKLLSVTDGVIVYGDHTTVVKYIDFDFIVGADGTKVLLSSTGQMIKYLYYSLTFFNISAEGYKRHFSILKRLSLPVPKIEEQQKIASFLSSIDQKIKLVANQVELAQTFKKGLFQQMFV